MIVFGTSITDPAMYGRCGRARDPVER